MQFQSFYKITPAETVADKFKRALGLHQAQRIAEAQKLYREILNQQPRHFDALHLLGVIAAQAGDFLQAVNLISQALAVDSRNGGAHANLGNAQQALGNGQAAAECFLRAIILWPDFAEALNNCANVLLDLGAVDFAYRLSCRAIFVAPGFADAQVTYGRSAQAKGDLDRATKHFEIAIVLQPFHAQALNNLGIAHHSKQDEERAFIYFSRAAQITADYWQAWNNLGNSLIILSHHKDAAQIHTIALCLRPDHADAYTNLSTALNLLTLTNSALSVLEKAIAIDPVNAMAWYNRGNSFKHLEQFPAAIACFEQAYAYQPSMADALVQVLHARALICDWRNLNQSAELMTTLGIDTDAIHPFGLLSLEDAPLRHKLRAEKNISQNFAARTERTFRKPPARPARLKIGYVSADFFDHATMFLMAGLLEQHDKVRFEIHAFSYGPEIMDEYRLRAERAVDHFHTIHRLSDRDAAAMSVELGIDIAIDLKGHTKDSRLGIFAHRAAPIQMTYLGYPGTIGADFIDYLIADETIIPDELSPAYSEKIIRLPDTYQVTDNKRFISPRQFSRSALDLPDQGLIFCCFNNSYKIGPQEFDIWMRLLSACPGSVLWLLNTNEWARANLQNEARLRGIDPGRLIFAPKLPPADHLARLRVADLFLDTFNYNAHTTANDALWAGVPVITKLGASFASRVAGSLLSALGLPELITRTEAEYEALALDLALNPNRLPALKARIAQSIPTAPLFNTALFASNIEAAFDQAYADYLAGV
jgi:predicted O-linked N-acetylglucosamine transferase (SPINDLY family)